MKSDSTIINYRRNNLDKSSSPYLLQHSDNPVWWQEWGKEILRYASEEKKPLLVSVGYSTCHWCHVMAAEAFSDPETAIYLNEHYICIKIDREQRPDIDDYMMRFMQSQSGSGGWPLNVFLTHDLRPVLAITYAAVKSDKYRLSFLEIARRVEKYIFAEEDGIATFDLMPGEPPVAVKENLSEEIALFYDPLYGGFGTGQKFPHHSTLLFLLYHLTVTKNIEIETICTNTLDVMMLGGLNDHLQGGIFRYCVDRRWTIPHFEKMLYDQALALWTYSLAFRVTGQLRYKIMAEKTLKCLDECFEKNGLYITAIDADTDHKEGEAYLWGYDEIAGILGSDGLQKFREIYILNEEGNFDGKNHLLRKSHHPLNDLEEKLLSVRKQRRQPASDEKILCGLNALTAIGLIQAARFLEKPELEEKARHLIERLLQIFWTGSSLGHSLFNGHLQKNSYLSDAGAMLTAITMLYESDNEWAGMMDLMSHYVESFREGDKWIESGAEDFRVVYSSWLDHPVPSGVSIAETGLTRAAILKDKNLPAVPYRGFLQSDFYNITAIMRNGLFHIFTSKKPLPWGKIPANSIQKRGEPDTDCYDGTCRLL